MTLDPETLRAMFRLAVSAWPALESADVEGWLWRSSGGGSMRANSASALTFHGANLDAAIADVEARYSLRGQKARFQVDDIHSPHGLANHLLGRGYVIEEETRTLAKLIDRDIVPHASCEALDAPTPDWLSIYLAAITPDRRTVNQQILSQVPRPRAFCLFHQDGRPTSTGLGVVTGKVAIVECMATTEAARRSGGARAVLGSIEAWAETLGAEILFLQVVDTNTPAIALYEKAGFRLVAMTRYFATN